MLPSARRHRGIIPMNDPSRPHVSVVLAVSADGKIAGADRAPARFSSAADRAHLERQIARGDATLFGARTLRAHQTTLTVRSPQLLAARQQAGKPPQPIQIVVSRSGRCNRQWRFFRQEIPRWLLTTAAGARPWQADPAAKAYFDRLLVADGGNGEISWDCCFARLQAAGIQRLAVLGGGELVAALAACGAIDELFLTVCPILLGGAAAPTPVDGAGLSECLDLELLEVRGVADEVFLHYRCRPGPRTGPHGG